MLLAYGLSPRWHDSLLVPFGSDFGGRPAYVNLPVPLKIILGLFALLDLPVFFLASYVPDLFGKVIALQPSSQALIFWVSNLLGSGVWWLLLSLVSRRRQPQP
jgi:hypothetical protein